MNWHVSLGPCKDCGKPFPLTRTARVLDVARGLSEPERCPDCRRVNAEAIRTRGAAYWEAPLELDDSKRCWGKYGLAKLVREQPQRQLIPDRSVPTDLPLRDPATILDPNDRALAKKFATIAPVAEALVKNLEDPNGTRVSIVVGPTGTGKSTWVPYRILRSQIGEQGRICVTQPRKITLRRTQDSVDDNTTPGFIARHLLRLEGGVGAGHEIGFQYSGEYSQQDRYTKLLYVTDGTLVRWLESGRVGQFGLVFIDEVHEQSSNMELILALLKYQLPRYPRLRVVLASATADVEKFRAYFGNNDPNAVFLAAPTDTRPTTTHPIHDRWLEEWGRFAPALPSLVDSKEPNERTRRLPEAVAATVGAICKQNGFTKLGVSKGDILVFLPTIAIVERTQSLVHEMSQRDRLGLNVMVSHAQMSNRELNEVKRSEKIAEEAAANGKPTHPQRVILATNYAETSVTFSNLSYVIDSGLILEPDWDPKTCSNRYEPQWHSQAGCTQRKGRVGRTKPGECFRLYTREEASSFNPHTPPEISRRPLDSFLLSAKAAGIEDLSQFDWLGKTSHDSATMAVNQHEFARSQKALTRRGTMDQDGDVTRRGLELGGIQVSRVELAECLSEADTFACALEMATFLAFIEQARGPFVRNDVGLLGYARWRSGCYDDLEFYLRVYHHWTLAHRKFKPDELKAWANSEGLNPDALESIAKSRKDNLKQFIRRSHDDPTERELDLKRLHRVRLVLAKCLPEWVYVPKEGENVYAPLSKDCPCTDSVEIDRESACSQIEEVNAFVCVERVSLRGGRLMARHVVRVNPKWLGPLNTLKPIGMAVLLAKTTKTVELTLSERSAASVTAPPLKIDLSRYRVGDFVKRLRAIRYQSSEDGKRPDLLLTEDMDTGYPVLARPFRRVEPGAVLRAHVAAIDHQRGRLDVNQKELHRLYLENRGKPLQGTISGMLTNTETGDVYAVWIDLEPGIVGRLHKRDSDVKSLGHFNSSQSGQKVGVCIDEVSDEGVFKLVTPAVFEGRKRIIKQGEVFEQARIREFYDSKDSRRVAVSMELVPGQNGNLNERSVSANYNFANWKIGQTFPVVVIGRDESDRIEVVERNVYEARRQPTVVGTSCSGLISGFDEPDGRRVAAFVEIRPGVNGYLSHSTWSMSYQEFSQFPKWQAKQRVDVAVGKVSGERKIDLITASVHKARQYTFSVGHKPIQGTVVGFDFGNPPEDSPVAAFVELLPGRHGYLKCRALGHFGAYRMSLLKCGDQIPVEITRAQGQQTDLKPWLPPIKVGDSVQGYVTGFLAGRSGHARAGVFVELQPNEQGFLHFSEINESDLLSLEEGEQLDVLVTKIERKDGKVHYSLSLK